MSGARCARPWTETERTDGHDAQSRHRQGRPQVGRSVPRLEGRDKVTGRAEYTHTMRLPGMLYGKIFRSTVRARPHQVDRHQRGEEAAGRAARRHRRGRDEGASPSPITARRSTTSRSSRSTRCASSASRSRPCSPPTRTSPSRRCSSSPPNTRSCPRSIDEVEAMTSKVYRARRAQARRHLRRPQASQGRQATPTSRSTTGCAAATSTRPSPRPSTCSSTTFRTQQVLHLPLEPFVSHRRLQGHPRHASTPRRRARRSCASRSRGCSAGRRTGCA